MDRLSSYLLIWANIFLYYQTINRKPKVSTSYMVAKLFNKFYFLFPISLVEKGRFASPDLRRTDTEVTQKSYLRRMKNRVRRKT